MATGVCQYLTSIHKESKEDEFHFSTCDAEPAFVYCHVAYYCREHAGKVAALRGLDLLIDMVEIG